MIDRTGSHPNEGQIREYFGCLNDMSSSLIKTLLEILKTKRMLKTYSEPCQTAKMELFAKLVTDEKPLAILA